MADFTQTPLLSSVRLSPARPRTTIVIAATLLGIGVATGIEDHAVAGLQVDLTGEFDVIAPHGDDASGEGAALFSGPCGHELLMIDAMHPSAEQTAGERHLHLIAIRGGYRVFAVLNRSIEGLAINLTDSGNVFGGL